VPAIKDFSKQVKDLVPLFQSIALGQQIALAFALIAFHHLTKTLKISSAFAILPNGITGLTRLI
jgi:hypothetical protein